VTSDPNIFRAAKFLLDQHGEKATATAARRVADCVANEDAEGVATWNAILAAIVELRRGRREGEKVN